MDRYLIFIETNTGVTYRRTVDPLRVYMIAHIHLIFYEERYESKQWLQEAIPRWLYEFDRGQKELMSIYDIHIERNI